MYAKQMNIHNFSKPASLWIYFISDRPMVSDIPMIPIQINNIP